VYQVRIERLREYLFAKVLIVHPAAFEVCVRVDQMAVRHVVSPAGIADWIERVIPCSRVLGRRADQRVEVEVAVARSERGQVLADVHLDCRLAVAEQVVRGADARRDVLQVDLVGRSRWVEDARWHELVVRTTDAGVWVAGTDAVVAYAALEGQARTRIGILRVERRHQDVALVLHSAGKDGGLGELIGDAIVEPVLNERGEVEIALTRVTHVALIPELQAMRAG